MHSFRADTACVHTAAFHGRCTPTLTQRGVGNLKALRHSLSHTTTPPSARQRWTVNFVSAKNAARQSPPLVSSSFQATSKSATKSAGQRAKPVNSKHTVSANTAQTNQAVSNQSPVPAPADPACPKASSATVAGDADVMLNQTNIGENNNKFYRLQLLQESNGEHWLWSRWGRVGDKGQTKLQGPFDAVTGLKEFNKKFRSKVGAKFTDKDGACQVRQGKYSLVDLDSFDSPAAASLPKTAERVVSEYAKSKLDMPTQELIDLIFSDDMFKGAMQEYDIDTDRLPLGQLSSHQVQMGYDVLERLKNALKTKADRLILEKLSSEFYQVIPHSFGRRRPPVISSTSAVDVKVEMCNVLSDITVAQDMLGTKQEEEEKTDLPPHPADEKYASLMADMEIIQPDAEEYRIIEKYCQATGGGQQLLNLWRVDRPAEGAGFAQHSQLDNRKLLWHGTNIAVVAAIIKAGLRIMPNAGGRVGRGLYLASEHSKSAGYVRCGYKDRHRIGVMFLAEAALGKEHHITRDDSSLRQAPEGFHSIVARGQTEPDDSQDVQLNLEGNAVRVPQGKPIRVSEFESSSFSQSEYLLYQESQARIRYMLTMKF